MADIKPLEARVGLDATTHASYGTAFSGQTLGTDLIGQIGMQVASSAAQARAIQSGIENGTHPDGDTMPPVTKADLAYNKAYEAQSQATLSIQAQQLFADADENISKLNKLSPQDIIQYQKTVQSALASILDVAPNTVKANLANQFSSQLVTNSHNYNTRLITQNHNDEIDTLNLAADNNLKQIYDAGRSGDINGMRKLEQAYDSLIDNARASGKYSASKSEGMKNAARLTSLSAAETRKALEFKKSGRFEELEAQWASDEYKPDDVSWSDWDKVISQTYAYMGKLSSYEAAQNHLLYSDAVDDIATGNMTAARFADYEDKLKESPQILKNIKLQMDYMNHKSAGISKATQQAWGLATEGKWDMFASQGKKAKNDVFNQTVEQRVASQNLNGRIASRDAIELSVASSMPVPIPYVSERMSRMVFSRDAEQMDKALGWFNILSQQPFNKIGQFMADTPAYSALMKYKSAKDNTNNSQYAAEQAYATSIPKDKNYEKVISNMEKSYYDNMGRNDDQTKKILRNLDDESESIKDGVPIINPSEIVSNYRLTFRKNLTESGDVKVAEEMTVNEIRPALGISYMAGNPVYMRLPAEGVMGFKGAEERVAPMVRAQLSTRLIPQLEQTKVAYDSGATDFYYRVKETPKFSSHEEEYNYYSKNGVTVEFVQKTVSGEHTEELTAIPYTMPSQSINQETGELTAPYGVQLIRMGTGSVHSFMGMTGARAPNLLFELDRHAVDNYYSTPEERVEKQRRLSERRENWIWLNQTSWISNKKAL